VTTYQIPVPKGDCSIHVRCCNGAPETAIIMDGGKGENVVSHIDAAWNYIKTKHNNVKLAGWVVTHWDDDHYEGTQMWLKNDRDPLADVICFYAGHDPPPAAYDVSYFMIMAGAFYVSLQNMPDANHAPEHRRTFSVLAIKLSASTFSPTRSSLTQTIPRPPARTSRSFCAWPPTAMASMDS
jgi:glyoxylase-like metal-dependent hydrolase (beta-lactamase superfamily II)